MTSQEKLELIQEIADEAKAQRIETVDLRGKTVMWDAFLVCSGTSDVHVRSIADRIEEQMRNHKAKASHVEGRSSGWVLLDFGDVACHVMREDERQYYDLESLWQTAPKRPDILT
ncbi:MAG: ribosome silencing factor [Fimbriimonadales bacterium]